MIKRQIIKDNNDEPVGVIIDYKEYLKLKKIERDLLDTIEAEKAEEETDTWTDLEELADELGLKG